MRYWRQLCFILRGPRGPLDRGPRVLTLPLACGFMRALRRCTDLAETVPPFGLIERAPVLKAEAIE